MKLFSHFTLFSKVLPRFPLALLCSYSAAILGMLAIHEYITFDSWDANLLLMLLLGFPLYAATRWGVEHHAVTNKNLLQGVLLVLITIFLAFYGAWILPVSIFDVFDKQVVLGLQFFLFNIVAWLIFLISPFLLLRQPIDQFWYTTELFLFRFAQSALYAGIAQLGVSMAFLALNALFSADIPGQWYADVWLVLAGIWAPSFFLSNLPTKLPTTSLFTSRNIGNILTDYIITPLVCVYFVILYTYIGKILVTGQWPDGMLVYLIIGFSIAGIGNFLMQYVNNDGKIWRTWYRRGLFIAMFPLIATLFWSIWLRISAYGVTENRYFVVALGIWLAVVALYSIVSKKQDIRLFPISLIAILLISSGGPLGAFSVARHSQVNRMVDIMESYDAVDDTGVFQPIPNSTKEDQNQLIDTLDYLVDTHGWESVLLFFPGNTVDKGIIEDSWNRWEGIDQLKEYLKIEDTKVTGYSRDKYISLAAKDSIHNIAGYDQLCEWYQDSHCSIVIDKVTYTLDIEDKFTVRVMQDEQVIYSRNFKEDLMKKINLLTEDQRKNTYVDSDAIALEYNNDVLRIKLLIDDISLEKKEDKYQIYNAYGKILIGR